MSPRRTPRPSGSLPVDEIRPALLGWYRPADRELPFRGATDPWAVLVSEAMAQQTQAARAGSAWMAFMARFPDPASLASSSPAEVLRAWRGLGYNRRALALQRAASVIVAEHDGRVPSSVAELERLPGVGPYTARAVAAIAFGVPVGAVDTNVRRVIGRLMGPGPTPGARDLQELADALVDPARPGAWTHALMDLGATVCRPATADCPTCPLRSWCGSAAAGGPGDAVGDPGQAQRRRRSSARDDAVPFHRSNRWLRGRIVDRLRDAPDEAWTAFDGPIGDHPPAAVRAALDGLASEGLVERPDDEPLTARLPTVRP